MYVRSGRLIAFWHVGRKLGRGKKNGGSGRTDVHMDNVEGRENTEEKVSNHLRSWRQQGSHKSALYLPLMPLLLFLLCCFFLLLFFSLCSLDNVTKHSHKATHKQKFNLYSRSGNFITQIFSLDTLTHTQSPGVALRNSHLTLFVLFHREWEHCCCV